MQQDSGWFRGRLAWLLLGAAIAVVLGWALLFRPAPAAGSVAVVNGVNITAARVARFESELQGQSRDRRSAVTRAVDEELWLQRAWKLGLVHADEPLRDALIARVQQRVLAQQPYVPATTAQLRELYVRHPEQFRQLSGVRVRRWLFAFARGGQRSAWERATEAHNLLVAASPSAPSSATGFAGPGAVPRAAPAAVAALADQDSLTLGDEVLALPQLRKIVGMEMTILIAQLHNGEFSRPVQGDGAVFVYQMLQRDAAVTPPFATVGPQIAQEFVRQAQEDVLLKELHRLRAEAQIELRPDSASSARR